MSNGKGGYVLIDVNPLIGPGYVVKDKDTVTSRYAFELLQKILTGVMPVCTKIGEVGISMTGGSATRYRTGTFHIPDVFIFPNGVVKLIFTAYVYPFGAKTCLLMLTITPSAKVDENGNPLEEATAVWNIYENAE